MMYSPERTAAEEEWRDYNAYLDAQEKRVRAHQERIDSARQRGDLLQETDRCGSHLPGYHKTPEGIKYGASQ